MEAKKKGLSEQAFRKLNPGEEFMPYVPASKIVPEFTVLSVIIGIILSIVFGAANAYLGLRVGMTVSASIPAAVVSMAIIRGIMGRNSILENNMVQTIASAGESLAAGAIFTIPALFMWGENPDILTITLITFLGGAIGILCMIPLRRFLIVDEHGNLPYPEGTACAEVLVAGEVGGVNASTVFAGLGIGAIFKYIADGLKLFPSEIEWQIKGWKNAAIGGDAFPSLLGVGFIIGPNISAYMLAGAVLGWLGFIPLISMFGGESVIYPGTVPISQMDYWGIWSTYVRYIGAGAVATGGIISLVKSIPTIINAFSSSLGGFKDASKSGKSRIDTDLPMNIVLICFAVIIVAIAFLPQIPVGIMGAILVAVFGFFFVTVSSRLVGIVGSSSNPVSGMTIATLLFTTIIFKAIGFSGTSGMVAALSVGAVICTAAAIAGDISQDLKTGYLVGATPWRQQIGEIIGVAASAAVIGYILVLLNNTYTFGSKELGAPQATIMMLVVQGIMNANLPWGLVFAGAASAVVIELFGFASLPFAIGLYLPIHTSVPIMVGGLVRGILDRSEKNAEVLKQKVENGVLYSSGLIAGDALVGIIMAFFASIGVTIGFDSPVTGKYVTLLFFLALMYTLVRYAFRKPKNI
ncbi:MAG: oligopeptide transporter, OPT family [Thermoanaerobacteraceae bacterium]|nr:oligopeptide transporter, OPT family [Thermoanaerobacteraceae bacterium]